MDEWVKQLAASDDPLRAKLHAAFEANEPELRQRALRAAEKFDEKAWIALERKLSKRARLVPAGASPPNAWPSSASKKPRNSTPGRNAPKSRRRGINSGSASRGCATPSKVSCRSTTRYGATT